MPTDAHAARALQQGRTTAGQSQDGGVRQDAKGAHVEMHHALSRRLVCIPDRAPAQEQGLYTEQELYAKYGYMWREIVDKMGKNAEVIDSEQWYGQFRNKD